MNTPKSDRAATRAAKHAFPRRLRCQKYFVRGWQAELGCHVAQADMMMNNAESDGARVARDYRQMTASSDKQAQIVALRLASPMRPLDRTSAPVDGLALFDAHRSPTFF